MLLKRYMSTVKSNKHFKVVIVGGGTGGCSLAAQVGRYFQSKYGDAKNCVAVIEPSDNHYYQPLWTLVGAGLHRLSSSIKPMGHVLSPDVTWIQARAVAFEPGKNRLTTAEEKDTDLCDGKSVRDTEQSISYDYLVIASGLELNFEAIKGMREAMHRPGVGSIYSRHTVRAVKNSIDEFLGGRAIFTFPATPIKCGGAPQKIMHLATFAFSHRDDMVAPVEVEYHTAGAMLFPVPKYRAALEKLAVERNIKVNYNSELVEVKPEKRVAVFRDVTSNELTEREYNMLHVTPPMRTCAALRENADLVDQAGFLDVDKETLRHARFDNIFGIGDCTSVPTSKTATAVFAQLPILRQNLITSLESEDRKSVHLMAKYNGYTACPIVIGDGKCILAEFDFQTPPRPMETFPFDQAKPSTLAYFCKTILFPRIYWRLGMQGRWELPKTSIQRLWSAYKTDN